MTLNLLPARLFRLLFPRQETRLVDQLAGEVARQCRVNLAQRAYRHAADMSVAGIRGYVRAQAAGCVESEVRAVACRHHLKPTLAAKVTCSAIEQLVCLVVRDILNGELASGRGTLAA